MSADLAGRSSMNRRTVVAGCVALAGTQSAARLSRRPRCMHRKPDAGRTRGPALGIQEEQLVSHVYINMLREGGNPPDR